jgi:hypothetical protein
MRKLMSLEDIDALKNASIIIERFGGIRPMAAKVGAPVTTVQGWKKRDVIPGGRREDVIKAANENSIDISDLLDGAPVVTAASVASVEKAVKTQESAFIDTPPASAPAAISPAANMNDDIKITVEPIARPKAPYSPPIDTTHEELMAAIAKGQKKAVSASIWTALGIAALLAGAGTLALLPSAKKIEKHEEQLATLDEDIREMNESAAAIKEMVPEDMRRKMAELKAEAAVIGDDMKKVAQQAEGLSKAVLASDAGSLSDRLSVIEAKLADVEGGQAVKDLAARIRGLEVTVSGQEQLGASVAELTKIVDAIDGQVNMLDDKMAQAQETPNNPLGQTLEGVSGNDMKAAALLIAFSQLRDSLNRNVPFEDDVVLLQKLVGDEDPELQAALTRLAPQAVKGGVLTSEGLSEEFKGYAGDIVFSSLKGEDVSAADKAKVRITQMLNVKKDGELVGGTATQKTVAKAQEQLDNNDIQGAIETLNTLDGEAKTQAAPFIQQAEAAILADQIQNMLRQMIVANVGANMNTATGSPAPTTLKTMTDKVQSILPQEQVVKDEESGFAILPAPKGFKGFSPGQTE